MEKIVKEYSNDEITIVWKPDLCIHATFCWKELPEVFKPQNRPWVNPQGANTERIIRQLKRCPSGALSYYENNQVKKTEKELTQLTNEILVEVVKGGPLLVHGDILLKDKNGSMIQQKNITAFCRCSMSKNQPYCDGAHEKTSFKG
jgi:uncharacterized Fe-S cluster protein YjdI